MRYLESERSTDSIPLGRGSVISAPSAVDLLH